MHLTLSDLSMGCYFLLVAIFNEVYEGNFVKVAHLWKSGLQCKVLSFLSLLSFQVTLYMVCVLSLERFIALCFPMKTFFSKLKLARLTILSGWVLSILIALYPVVITYINQTQLNNALCVILLSFKQLNLWYVLGVFIINTSVSLFNVVMYLSIIHVLRQRQKQLAEMTSQQLQHRKQMDTAITIRIVCCVFTNSTCWIVMVLIGICLQSGMILESKLFSVCAVVALPISALLNPIINIFTTSEFMGHLTMRYLDPGVLIM